MPPPPSPYLPYDAARFELALQDALSLTSRVLSGSGGGGPSAAPARDAPHAYSDKYALAEAQQGAAAAAFLGALSLLGLSGDALATVAGW